MVLELNHCLNLLLKQELADFSFYIKQLRKVTKESQLTANETPCKHWNKLTYLLKSHILKFVPLIMYLKTNNAQTTEQLNLFHAL